MTIELVISRFNEDISWIKKVPSSIKVTIYNKGKNDISFDSINLPNVGRESNTYLEHILRNYHQLATTTIFSQADPFDHSPYFLQLLNKINMYQKIQPLSFFYNKDTPPINIRKLLNTSKKGAIYVEYLNNNFIPCYPGYWYNHDMENLITIIQRKYKTKNIVEYLKKKLNLSFLSEKYLLPVNYGALFAVNKEIILKHNQSFYSHLNNVLLNTYDFDMGYFYERLWLSIFYYQKYNSYYQPLLVSKYNISNFVLYPSKKEFTLKKKINFNEYIGLELSNQEIYSFNIYKKYMIFTKKYRENNKKKENKRKIYFQKPIQQYIYFIIEKAKHNKLNNYIFILKIHQKQFILPQDVFIKKITIFNLQKFNQNEIMI